MRRPAIGLVIVGLGASLAPLDIAVNVALPAITAHFGLALGDVQWLVICYVLVYGSLMLVCGKLGDLFGRKRTLVAGLMGFAAASAIGGLAQSFAVLIGARALQGVFGALLAPSTLSLLTLTFQYSQDRQKAFGIFTAIAGSGASLRLYSEAC